MRLYERRYDLHGIVDTVCIVVADIRHQGRAKSRHILEALHSGDALGNLLKIGEEAYPRRIETLREAIVGGEERGVFGRMKYDQTVEDFVPI